MATKKSRKAAATKKSKAAARKAPARRVAATKKAPPRKVAKKAAPRKLAKKVAPRKAAKKAAARKPVARKAAARKTAARAARPRDGRPPQMPSALIPYLTVNDAEASLIFYEEAFGFAPHGPAMRDKDGRVMHAAMRLGEAMIMFAPQTGANPMRTPASTGAPDSLTLYVYVPDVDAQAQRAEHGGATVLQLPADQFWGDRITVCRDPDGYNWTFATNVAEFDPSKAPF